MQNFLYLAIALRVPVDVENLEGYVPGGYHPALIGDTFSSGRYNIVHKLGFGGYSTIWLAWDTKRLRYVALKILTAWSSPDSHEGDCLVGEPAGGSIATSKENSTNLMFPLEAARSTAAQLLLGLSHLHANDICHGDLDGPSIHELYQRFGKPFEVPIHRVDGKPSEPHVPPHAIYP
ncbi:hypothetical protein N7481_013154 [Penicillium waksmanii]|uniref:uncharacterized protein n=1 Tax=Penicillium waksmanii TaxID=69791 RepID=UPI002548173E|nr:uncharacterized protein N7481_013154 [Penicillium waksmanii]KAJ5966440.1 hypothetical protein N7481_013154 [Penicillium waksmanii]